MLLWHVTPTRNVFSILEEGLVPAIGPRSEELGEGTARLYVFTDRSALEDALSNWLGEAFDEDELLSILELDVADEHVVVPPNLFEAHVLATVAPGAIVRIVPESEWLPGEDVTPLAKSHGIEC